MGRVPDSCGGSGGGGDGGSLNSSSCARSVLPPLLAHLRNRRQLFARADPLEAQRGLQLRLVRGARDVNLGCKAGQPVKHTTCAGHDTYEFRGPTLFPRIKKGVVARRSVLRSPCRCRVRRVATSSTPHAIDTSGQATHVQLPLRLGESLPVHRVNKVNDGVNLGEVRVPEPSRCTTAVQQRWYRTTTCFVAQLRARQTIIAHLSRAPRGRRP